MRRRLVVVLASAVAVVSGAASAVLTIRTDSVELRNAGPDVALLSPRRVPALFRDLVAETRLNSRVSAVMRSMGPSSCTIVRAGTSDIVAVRSDEMLIPASALKLTTAAAFLAEVGGKGRFTTTVAGRRPDSAGVVAGDLVLVGGGDPLLATSGYVETRKHPPKPATDFAELVAGVRRAGVRRVSGGVGVYDALFDSERRVSTWSNGYTANGDVGPLGALAVDDGFSAHVPRLVPSSDPALSAGNAFRASLTAAGIAVDGPTFRVATAPTGALASVESAPYAEVVSEMLRESDNNTAELLLKELARRTSGAPGTRTKGLAAREEALGDLGLDAEELEAVDGSGLDRGNRASCGVLLGTLTTRPGGYELEDMLATAGRNGTLDDRFTSSALVGKLRAKTGSLANVTALVGVTDPDATTPLRFAFVVNGQFSDAGGKALQDRFVATLATYPEAPPVAVLAP